jgi:CheY-like chemotaxis protein
VSAVDRQKKMIGRILVSESEDAVAVLWRRMLEVEGYEVRTSLDASETLELARSWQPDAITTDLVKPPPTTGLELIAQLRSDERTRGIPIIVVSAHAANPDCPEAAQEALDAGVFSVLTKPLDPRDLIADIERARAPG